jgi:hypothetical protein
MTRNEAAERLRETLVAFWVPLPEMFDAALAEERRHVIEQIRERVGFPMGPQASYEYIDFQKLAAILDDLSTPEPLTDNQRKAIAQQALLSTPEQKP